MAACAQLLSYMGLNPVSLRVGSHSKGSLPSPIAASWLEDMVNIYYFRRSQIFHREIMSEVRCFHAGKVKGLFLGQGLLL